MRICVQAKNARRKLQTDGIRTLNITDYMHIKREKKQKGGLTMHLLETLGKGFTASCVLAFLLMLTMFIR